MHPCKKKYIFLMVKTTLKIIVYIMIVDSIQVLFLIRNDYLRLRDSGWLITWIFKKIYFKNTLFKFFYKLTF